jgi:uncharacterized protein (AIM24 family)
MKYQIFGSNLPAVTISLDQGEAIYTQSGGMSWMTSGMKMDTNMKGGFMKGLGRMLSGDSLLSRPIRPLRRVRRSRSHLRSRAPSFP